jgi:putative zinc finger/helix-turn-helix YgiT family protein
MKSNYRQVEARPELDGVAACPSCGHSELETQWIDCPFPYGIEPDTVELDVRLPVRKCCQCGFEFFDEEAEDLRHEAVCQHLGVLTPADIRALRAKLGFSRAELARVTRLGEATIARWERGELIQNAGYDSLLRLLQYEENVRRLQRQVAPPAEAAVLRIARSDDPQLREKQAAFKVSRAS